MSICYLNGNYRKMKALYTMQEVQHQWYFKLKWFEVWHYFMQPCENDLFISVLMN